MMSILKRNKYDIYNKIKLKKPEIGKAQSLLFSTLITSTNPQNNKSEENIFEREVDIIYLGLDEQYDVFQIFYLDANFKLSNKYKSDTSYLKKISFAFDDLLLGVDYTGNIKAILNIGELKNRWEQIEEELNNTHEGIEFEHYKKGIKKMVANEVDLINFLKLPSMYGNYFNGLWDTFHYEAFYDNIVRYGKEIDYKEIKEKVLCKKIISDELNQVLEMEVSANQETDIKHYEGFYSYYNGYLNNFKKNIAFNNINTIYTIQWKGIQPIIQ